MSSQPKSFLTPEQYLEIERKAEYMSESLNGEVFAVSGASEVRNLLTVNLTLPLGPQIRTQGCRLYVRLHAGARSQLAGLFTYPYVVVVCGKRQFSDDKLHTLLNPTFLAEVLSPSIEAYDRGRKFEHYRRLESLSQYLLVAQDYMHADRFARQADGGWVLTGVSEPEETLELQSIGCKLTMADLYQDVTLPPPQLTGELRP